ncbi:response regulator [Flavobacterium sp.]|uniref:response regulator n=1 Tax=Flavobacterium sp. TaxID=239 RepID=UPI002B4B6B4A|nr:response regulator [Flavobacterium sp.]HLP64947.1 response regulator [Flavobacterium sp.]
MLNKILCVDDDPITLMLCKKVIAKANFTGEIESAKDGIEALKFFDTINNESKSDDYPELIFLDLNMPIMDGWEFLDEFSKNLSQAFPKTKIIVLSSSIDPKDINKSKNYPMVLDFLPKPITVEMLNNIKHD